MEEVDSKSWWKSSLRLIYVNQLFFRQRSLKINLARCSRVKIRRKEWRVLFQRVLSSSIDDDHHQCFMMLINATTMVATTFLLEQTTLRYSAIVLLLQSEMVSLDEIFQVYL